MPPANEVPPITAPAIANSSNPWPCAGRIVVKTAAKAIPLTPAKMPLTTYADSSQRSTLTPDSRAASLLLPIAKM